MRKVTVWIGQKDTLIPADLIPGSIADSIYPRPDRSQAVERQSAAGQAVDSETLLASFPLGMDGIANQSDEFAVKRLEEERAQARKLREKFPNLPSDYCFSESEAVGYLATLSLELVVRRYSSALDPEGRWLGRQFIDSYANPGAVISKKFPSEVSSERCLELARQSQLHVEEWIELTGVGIGHHGPYSVSDKGVFFETWSEEQVQGADTDWQIEMLRDNRTAPKVAFPCSPVDLTRFVQNAIGIHRFTFPSAFVNELSSEKPEDHGWLTKSEILGISDGWPLPPSAPLMENILKEIPKWVGDACKRIGSPGKGSSGSHRWNPAILGFCCVNEAPRKKWIANKKKMGDFLQKYFKTFYPQWEEITENSPGNKFG